MKTVLTIAPDSENGPGHAVVRVEGAAVSDSPRFAFFDMFRGEYLVPSVGENASWSKQPHYFPAQGAGPNYRVGPEVCNYMTYGTMVRITSADGEVEGQLAWEDVGISPSLRRSLASVWIPNISSVPDASADRAPIVSQRPSSVRNEANVAGLQQAPKDSTSNSKPGGGIEDSKSETTLDDAKDRPTIAGYADKSEKRTALRRPLVWFASLLFVAVVAALSFFLWPTKVSKVEEQTPPADGPQLIALFGNWQVYAGLQNSRKTCFAISFPKNVAAPPADLSSSPFAMVASFPADKVVDEFSTKAGAFVDNRGATAEIGGNAFDLFSKNDAAWLRNPMEQPRIMDAMRTGSTLVVKISSTPGSPVNYQYSLDGLVPALDRVHRECQ